MQPLSDITGPAKRPLVDIPQPASIARVREAVAMRTQKACGHAVRNCSCVANWDHRKLSYDAVYWYHPLIVSVFTALLSRIQLVQPICQQKIQIIELAIRDSRRMHNPRPTHKGHIPKLPRSIIRNNELIITYYRPSNNT